MQASLASRGAIFLGRSSSSGLVAPCRMPVAVRVAMRAVNYYHRPVPPLLNHTTCCVQPAKVTAVDVEAGMGGKLKTRKVETDAWSGTV